MTTDTGEPRGFAALDWKTDPERWAAYCAERRDSEAVRAVIQRANAADAPLRSHVAKRSRRARRAP